MKEDFIYCSPENCTDILWIDLAGISYCDGNYVIKREKSNVFVLEFVMEGTGTIIHNGQKFTASEGEVYLLHKGAQHHYYSSKDKPWVKIWINLKGSLLEHLLDVYGLNSIVYPGNEQILGYFKAFHQTLLSGSPPQEIQKNCALLLHNIVSSIYYNSNENKQNETDDASKIKRYLDQHMLESVSLNDLSMHLYKSKAQTIRIFKKKYGITPYAYLMSIKLQYAKKLLAHTNTPIKEISSRIGFCDEHYFSAYFKQNEKISPSEYRSNPSATDEAVTY